MATGASCAQTSRKEGSNTMRAYRTKKKALRRVLFGAGCAALVASAAQADDFKVELNETKALHLAKPVSTVIVGNPAIADVAVEGSKLIYVMGRSFGTTNLVATDSEGKAVLNLDVSVVSQSASSVTLTRGTGGQLSYNCTPRCERVAGVGDNPDSYDAIMKQVSGALSTGAGATQGASTMQAPAAE
ncbi:pilus assembly protein N-terminal domain-containing protein [Parvibaculum sp.]|uniref:pilus assembly protein N-terminal domain-containing protein n=1 Tax=Parvibaculum sp. TaxID=2024848 RepID=UPI0032992A61